MLRHALPDFRRVWLGRRHFGKMVAPRNTVRHDFSDGRLNNQAICFMMMLMLRYINGENMKHWKLGIVCPLLTGAAYAAPLPVVTSFSILGDVAETDWRRPRGRSKLGGRQPRQPCLPHDQRRHQKKSSRKIGIAQRRAWKPPMCNAQSNRAKCLSLKRPKASEAFKRRGGPSS